MSGDGCPICGHGCIGHPSHPLPAKYPFVPGGVDPMANMIAGRDFVYAPHAIADPALERVVYGAGDPVPMADAIRFGLVAAPEPAPQPAPVKGRRARRKASDRAIHGPVDTGAHTPSEDR